MNKKERVEVIKNIIKHEKLDLTKIQNYTGMSMRERISLMDGDYKNIKESTLEMLEFRLKNYINLLK